MRGDGMDVAGVVEMKTWLMKIRKRWFDPIIPGEERYFVDEIENPFSRDDYKVIVLEVKEGWVRFKPKYESHRELKIGVFRHCYVPLVK